MGWMEWEPKDGMVNLKIKSPRASSTLFEVPRCGCFDKQSHKVCLATVHI